MDKLDWDQPATLDRVTEIFETRDQSRRSGLHVFTGTLRAVVSAYVDHSVRERPKLRISVAGGFHLDGAEIDALVERPDFAH